MMSAVQKVEHNILYKKRGWADLEKTMFDYSKLKGRITEKCGTQKAFAKLMGFTESTLTGKLLGYTYFSQEEIFNAIEVLQIQPSRIEEYFFTAKVQ